MRNVKLVLSGSGVLYPAHVGAIVRLNEAGFKFDAVAGTSGGSIIAAALASGYKPNSELISLVKKTLPSNNNLIDPSIWSLIRKWGFIKGDKIHAMLQRHLCKKIGESKIPTYIVTTNLDKREIEIFNSLEHPDMSMALAVRASMSIPGVFVPVEIGKTLYVDGGVTGNLVMDLFGKDADVIGIRFVSGKGKSRKIDSSFDYMNAVLDSMLDATVNERIEDVDDPKIINIKSKFNHLNFWMSESECQELIDEGYRAADKWILKQKVNDHRSKI